MIYYDINGKESYHECMYSMARKEESGNKHNYYIKFNTVGMETAHMINPNSPFFDSSKLTRFDTSRGKPYCEYRLVSKLVFDLYLRFLKTQNEAHYRKAERELG